MNTLPKVHLDGLTTESRNQDTLHIDRQTTLQWKAMQTLKKVVDES